MITQDSVPDNSNNDPYQIRYEAHQKKKALMLKEIIKKRYSERVFSPKPPDTDLVISIIDECKEKTPCSCNRRPYIVHPVLAADLRILLGSVLVGAVGWAHRCPLLLLIFLEEKAYKAPGEINYMPYLDAGFLCCNIINRLTEEGMKTCFINPNIRDFNRPHFENVFNAKGLILGGCIAVGYSEEL